MLTGLIVRASLYAQHRRDDGVRPAVGARRRSGRAASPRQANVVKAPTCGPASDDAWRLARGEN